MMFKQLAVLALAGTAFAAPQWQGNYGYWHWPGNSASSSAPAPTPTDSGSSAPSAPSATAPAASPTSSASSGSSGSSTDDYMTIVNNWRVKGGLPELTKDSTLEANAMKTVNDDKGTMTHELNPGSMAQVLAPGDSSNFENVYVGGWLCEEPNLPGLDGICSSMDQGWDHSSGETGHAQILTSTSYTKIGCALAYGLWGCDLA